MNTYHAMTSEPHTPCFAKVKYQRSNIKGQTEIPMLKIMEVHPSLNPCGEYVVLQNVGLVTINLKGCAICTDAFLSDSGIGVDATNIYLFRDEVSLRPYMRVVLFTGSGENAWVPTVDGKHAYCAFWGRHTSVWSDSQQVHFLQLSTSRRVPTRTKDRIPMSAPRQTACMDTEPESELTRAEIERNRGCTFVCVGETEW